MLLRGGGKAGFCAFSEAEAYDSTEELSSEVSSDLLWMSLIIDVDDRLLELIRRSRESKRVELVFVSGALEEFGNSDAVTA